MANISTKKHRRYRPFQRSETVQLVREYLECTDELTTLHTIFQSKITILKSMRRLVEEGEEEEEAEEPDNPDGESHIVRLDWAIAIIKEADETCEGLMADCQSSLNAVRGSVDVIFAIVTDIFQ